MIVFEEALEIILNYATPAGSCMIGLDQSLGYALAAPIICPRDIPVFDNSAMDGYGVQVADIAQASDQSPISLKVTETIQAGECSQTKIQKGTAVRIYTGAPVPPGVEAIVMQEFCDTDNGVVQVRRSAKAGENIRSRGEEFRQGQQVLDPGTKIMPPTIGLLACLGFDQIKVFQKPSVNIITTGNELVQPGSTLAPGQVYDSNSYALEAALKGLGFACVVARKIKDDPAALKATISLALSQADVVITVGGISVGKYDFVKDVLLDLGVQVHFWKIAIKPGKPVLFGTLASKLIFSLPGNPVSALVTFYCFVRPALLKMSGISDMELFSLKAVLEQDLKKKPGKLEFVRGIASPVQGRYHVKPTYGQDSHMLGGLATANSLIYFPLELDYLLAGQEVAIELLHWL